MVIGVNANGASISPDPRIARDYSQPVQFTLTAPDGTKVVYNVTVKGAECLAPTPTPVPAPTPVDPMPTGAAIADRWFDDYGGGGTMRRRNADGSQIDADPPLASEITNPEYVLNDVNHSYWGINASAIDSEGRALTYSISITPTGPDCDNFGICSMSKNIKINAMTGLITQTCTPANYDCYDASTPQWDEFIITVTALPKGGAKPLVRTFKISVLNIG